MRLLPCGPGGTGLWRAGQDSNLHFRIWNPASLYRLDDATLKLASGVVLTHIRLRV